MAKVQLLSLILLALVMLVSSKYIKNNYMAIDSCKSPLKVLRKFIHKDIHACSGMAFHTPTKNLLMIHDRDRMVYMINSTTGNIVTTIRFNTVHDLECVAWDPINKRMLVCQEGKRRVHYFSWKKIEARKNDMELLDADGYYQIDTEAGVYYNGGLEAMTINKKTSTIYVANERGPPIFFEYTSKGHKVRNGLWLNFTRDASSMAYDESDDTIWLNSDASHQLYHISKQGDVLGAWDNNFAGEGLAIDNSHNPPILYMGWDRGTFESEIWVFQKPKPHCFDCTLPGKDGSVGSHKNHSMLYSPVPKHRCNYNKVVAAEAKRLKMTPKAYKAHFKPSPHQPLVIKV